MDTSTGILLSVALLLGLNNAVTRIPFLRERAALFWTTQLLDLGACLLLLIWGIPGFQHMPAISYMLGLLFLLHVATNLRWKARQRRDHSVDDEVESRRSAIRAALEETEE